MAAVSENIIRAAVCRAFGEPLSVEPVVLAAPQADEVRVKLSACAICHSDLMYMDGKWGGGERLPTVFGHEAAGVVMEWGGVAALHNNDASHNAPQHKADYPHNVDYPPDASTHNAQQRNTDYPKSPPPGAVVADDDGVSRNDETSRNAVYQCNADYPPLPVGAAVLVALMRACGRCAACVAGRPALCRTRFAVDDAPRLRSAAGEPIFAGLRTGAFAEEVVVHRSQVVAMPAGLSPVVGCLLSCGVLTGVGAVLNTAQMRAGARVAVVGCGGVGLNCVQGAVIAAARCVVAVDVAAEKLAAARAFGATAGIDAAREDVAAAARALVGDGFDYVFMAAGNAAAVGTAMALLAPMGMLVLVGMPASGDLAALDASDVAGGGKRIVGSKMGDGRLSADIPMLAAFYNDGRLKLNELVNKEFPFAQINEAIADARKSDSLRNVLVF